ncbi:unnamed protein product, partial [Symbiodinium sp. CCMP2456]
LQEPAVWRGGALMCLAKKVYHRILRDKLMASFATVRADLQAGQMPGIGVESISLMVRSFQAWARKDGQKTALVFFDVKTAFYMTLRQALVPSASDDVALRALLQGLGVPGDAVAELHDHLTAAAQFAEAGAGAHLTTMVADLLRGTWFRLDGAAALVMTERGSRPGDPLADLLFAFTFSAYVRCAEKALQAEPEHVGVASWADDYVMLQVGTTAVNLVQRVRAATGILISQASAVGMEVSFARDKTAVMFSSDCQLSGLPEFVTDPALGTCLPVYNSVLQSHCKLPAVDAYRHLGGILTANGVPTAEISFRYAQAAGMMRPLRGKLFAAGQIPLTIRRTLLRSLVISRFVFAGAILPLHTAIHCRQWDRSFVRLWQGLCRWTTPEQQPHSFQVLRQALAPSPPLAVALMRGVLLQRLLKHGPGTVLHMLHVHWRTDPSRAWLGQLLYDIRAVAVYQPGATALLGQACPVTALIEATQDTPAWWVGQLRAAIRAYGADLERWAQRTDTAGRGSPLAVGGELRPYACRWREATFVLRKHQAVHEARRHGMISPVRLFAWTAVCQSCLKLFHSVDRLHYHLKSSKECLARVVHVLPPMSPEHLRQVEREDFASRRKVRKGQWQHYEAARPSELTFGPRLPTASERLFGLDEDEITVADLQRLYRPTPGVLNQVMDFIDAASSEGPRVEGTDFWLRRPSCC